MSYTILAPHLFETGDWAQKYFHDEWGARKFKCEEAIDPRIRLRPTWHATLSGCYDLCIEVRESPFNETLFEAVNACQHHGFPVILWVAIPEGASGSTFASELRTAQQNGIGVVQPSGNSAHIFHQTLPLSLTAMSRLRAEDLKRVPTQRREILQSAEGSFLQGKPTEGCQRLFQELELLTRSFAEKSYLDGYWRPPTAGRGKKAGGTPRVLPPKFFQKDPWAPMLKKLENEIDVALVRPMCPQFEVDLITRARALVSARNNVSHAPRSRAERISLDRTLRTTFETTRQLVIDWHSSVKRLRLM